MHRIRNPGVLVLQYRGFNPSSTSDENLIPGAKNSGVFVFGLVFPFYRLFTDCGTGFALFWLVAGHRIAGCFMHQRQRLNLPGSDNFSLRRAKVLTDRGQVVCRGGFGGILFQS